MPPRIPPEHLSSQESAAELVEHLASLIDRTFAENGHGEGMRVVRSILMGLERPALRELVRQLGVEGPEELAEPDEEGRPVQIG